MWTGAGTWGWGTLAPGWGTLLVMAMAGDATARPSRAQALAARMAARRSIRRMRWMVFMATPFVDGLAAYYLVRAAPAV